ncbi:quercetin dioxygenase-like cupin family protein [Crossiella equi]|uniref:Quercetin dioxygenase-like cupin family protein n=1 Tax=Crossiella equi TaxID=130796 RepID=A0ABS5APA4_9PSEU|nr:cupin domain-containing protein [Crossiella equi]MBP2478408.1 quercetin dioxygenase-like cupin family protein [Crossiella equi]
MSHRRPVLRTAFVALTLGLGLAACAPAGANSPAPTAAAATSTLGSAPTDGVTRKELQRFPSPAKGWDVVQTLVEIPVGKESGKHSHPGVEIGYIVQGDVVIDFADGRPSLTLHTGEPFNIPPNVVHNARNVGTLRTKMLSSYLVEEGKPLVHMH